jgi:hypothetical protein
MYHTREASDPRDKVYALLGMSSDRQEYPQLSPDYTISWRDLLRRLVKSLLGEHVTATTWDHEEFSVIEGRGHVAGQVSAVASDRMMHDRQRVAVLLKDGSGQRSQKAQWTLPPSAKQIRSGDLICILQGASTPTIIRPYADYCAVVAISVRPVADDEHWPRTDTVSFTELIGSGTTFPHDLLLAWDWSMSGNNNSEAEHKEYATLIHNRLAKHASSDLQGRLNESIRTRNAEFLLGDLHQWKARAEQGQGMGADSERQDAEVWRARYEKVWTLTPFSGRTRS